MTMQDASRRRGRPSKLDSLKRVISKLSPDDLDDALAAVARARQSTEIPCPTCGHIPDPPPTLLALSALVMAEKSRLRVVKQSCERIAAKFIREAREKQS